MTITVSQERCKNVRAKLKLTQVRFAWYIGIHSMTVSKCERGLKPFMLHGRMASEFLVMEEMPQMTIKTRTYRLKKGLTRQAAIRAVCRRYGNDFRGFLYNPKTGVAKAT